MEACQRAVSSREFMEWVAFDEVEPIGTRVVPDLLALLISSFWNVYRKAGSRAYLPQDVFADPLAPRRLSEQEEATRVVTVMGDYRRLRAERLARESQSADVEGAADAVHGREEQRVPLLTSGRRPRSGRKGDGVPPVAGGSEPSGRRALRQ